MVTFWKRCLFSWEWQKHWAHTRAENNMLWINNGKNADICMDKQPSWIVITGDSQLSNYQVPGEYQLGSRHCYCLSTHACAKKLFTSWDQLWCTFTVAAFPQCAQRLNPSLSRKLHFPPPFTQQWSRKPLEAVVRKLRFQWFRAPRPRERTLLTLCRPVAVLPRQTQFYHHKKDSWNSLEKKTGNVTQNHDVSRIAVLWVHQPLETNIFQYQRLHIQKIVSIGSHIFDAEGSTHSHLTPLMRRLTLTQAWWVVRGLHESDNVYYSSQRPKLKAAGFNMPPTTLLLPHCSPQDWVEAVFVVVKSDVCIQRC